LDSDTESILFLTNESDQPAHIAFKVTANGSASYYLTSLQLNPHETRALDLRKLRDAQLPDFKKNLIPASATDGSVHWIRVDNVPVMGRLMVINRQQGMASNYDCCTCVCPADYDFTGAMEVSGSSALAVGQTAAFSAQAFFVDCNGDEFSVGVHASWTVDNSNVASVDSSGNVTGVGAGWVDVTASYSGCADWGGLSGRCTCQSVLPGSASIPLTVADGTPVINSISPDYWLVGATTTGVIVSGQHFGTSPIVNFSDPAVSCAQTSGGDTQITCNITVGVDASGGVVNVTVTSQGYNGSGFIALPNGGSQATSSSYQANKQRPGFVNVGYTITGSIRCGTSSFYADTVQVYYQVYDTTESPILRANMSAAETLSWQSSTCATSDGCGSKPTAATWQTDANGKFTDTIFNCSPSCIAGTPCDEDWQQKFQVNGAPVGILNGSSQGTMWCISTSCSSPPQGQLH
jgi:hypothetical protein